MKPIAKMIFVLRSRGSQLLPRCGLRELTPESVRRSPKPLGSWDALFPGPVGLDEGALGLPHLPFYVSMVCGLPGTR